PLLTELLAEGRGLAVERGEHRPGLLLMAHDHGADRLAEGLPDRVAALEVILRVRNAAGVVAAELDARCRGRGGGGGGRRGGGRDRRRSRRHRRGGGRD